MDGSRITKYDARQLFTWAAVTVFFLLLGVQFLVFGGKDAASGRTPNEVRTAQEKLRALDAARQALARLGTINLAAIPERNYAATNPATLAAEAAASAEAEEMESFSVAPVAAATVPAVAVVEVVPVLKGIVQSRGANGQIRLRAAYPHRIVAEGESVAGYRVEQITVESVTLNRNGKTIVQQIAAGQMTRRRGE
jgi:hypothetical protein